jgi:hypothetical protein
VTCIAGRLAQHQIRLVTGLAALHCYLCITNTCTNSQTSCSPVEALWKTSGVSNPLQLRSRHLNPRSRHMESALQVPIQHDLPCASIPCTKSSIPTTRSPQSLSRPGCETNLRIPALLLKYDISTSTRIWTADQDFVVQERVFRV